MKKVTLNVEQLDWVIENLIGHLELDEAISIADSRYTLDKNKGKFVFVDVELVRAVVELGFRRLCRNSLPIPTVFLSICAKLVKSEKPRILCLRFIQSPNKIKAIKEMRDFLRSDIAVKIFGETDTSLGTVKQFVEGNVVCNIPSKYVAEVESSLKYDGAMNYVLETPKPHYPNIVDNYKEFAWCR